MLRRCCALQFSRQRQSADASFPTSHARVRRHRSADLGLSAGGGRGLFQEAVRLGLLAPLRTHRAADVQFRLRRPAARLWARYGQGYGDSGFPQDYAKYRTLCVRTCDGFYFPIGDSVGRERLYNDARTCSARCDGEAKLFYYPTNGGSVDTMVDMAGRPYAQLPTAFLYRKTLVQGCTCKPAPWSAETAARHQGYKDEAAALAEMRPAAGAALRRPGRRCRRGLARRRWRRDRSLPAARGRRPAANPLGRRRPPLLSLRRPPQITVIPL